MAGRGGVLCKPSKSVAMLSDSQFCTRQGLRVLPTVRNNSYRFSYQQLEVALVLLKFLCHALRDNPNRI
jgi:hypothetical protein